MSADSDAVVDGAALAQYEGLAPIYDYVMRHVDYEEWVGYVDELFTRFGQRPSHLVDLACGTGSVTFEFDARGYRVSGIDASDAMIQVARQKAAERDRKISFSTGDVRRLCSLGPFDGAVCLYDSINYLMSLSEVDDALEQVWQILAPSSLFIFDVCTEKNSLHYFGDVHGGEDGDGFTYTRHSYYDPDERLQINAFDIRFERDGRHVTETHSQRIYQHDEMVDHVEASPFELLGAYDGFTFRRGSELSDRVHFVLQRPGE